LENKKPAIKLKPKKRKKLIAIVAIIILLAAIGGSVFYMNKVAAAKKQTGQLTAKVRTGDISVSVTGSGTLVSENKSDITTSLDGTVKKIYFKEGDSVKVGDLIMSLDDTDAQLNVEKAQSNLDQASVALSSNNADLASLTVKAPFDGEVVDIPLKIGDSVAKNGMVLTLTDKSKFKLVVPFKNNIRSKLKKGMSVSVTAYDSAMDELTDLTGTISVVNGASYKGADGTEIYNVQVSVPNNGTLKESMTAGVGITLDGNTYTSTVVGALSYADSRMVKCAAGGTVSNIGVSVGQVVKKGKVLAQLSNSDLVLTKQTNQLKVTSLQSELTAAKNQLGYCSIKSPIKGVLAKLNYKEGNSVKLGAVLLVLTDLDNMEFDVPVDELDIAKIKPGQSVSVTIDALTETTKKPLEAVVTKVALEGTTTSGVTTYAVTVKMNDSSQLKDGMNANGEITISDSKGILVAPIEAVLKRGQSSFLMIKGATASGNTKRQPRMSPAQQKYYQGASAVEVKTGISNAKFIEITEGAKAGDVVVLPQVTASTSSTTKSTNSTRGLGGGGFGGPPN